jgi:thioredoxin 2
MPKIRVVFVKGGLMAIAEAIRCPACGAVNRVSAEKIQSGLAPVCGRCKAPLPVGDESESSEQMGKGVLSVTDSTFANFIEKSSTPVLVDLWAPWCPPCRAIAPMIEKLAREMAGRVKFAKLNIDDSPATASRFRVDSIPTLLIFKQGREVDRIVGVKPEGEIRRRLERAAE